MHSFTKRSFRLWSIGVAVFLAVFTAFLCCGAEVAPEIVTDAPENNKNNVKIYFYVDGHKSMRLQRVKPFVRAIDALRKFLADRNNVLDARFRELGYSVTIMDEAYVFTPAVIEPFNLSTSKNLDNLVKEYKGTDFSAEEFYKKILNKNPSENAVIIIITNNSLFTEKQGIRYRDVSKKVTIFVLNAGQKSVKKESFLNLDPYWDTEDWEKFLSNSMGRSVNDIANVIAQDYYALSEDEQADFKKIIAKADRHRIVLKDLLHIPKKEMWKREILFNKKAVSTSENEISLSPGDGHNVLRVSLLSPVGYRYSIEWGGDDFQYEFLIPEEQKIVEDASKYAMEQPSRYAQVDIDNVTASKDYIGKPIKKVFRAPLLKSARQIVDTAETYADFSNEIQEMKKAIESSWKQSDFEDTVKDLENRLKTVSQAQFAELKSDLAKLKAAIKQREADELHNTRENVKEEIQAKISSYSKDSIQNYDELNALLRDAQNAKDIKGLETIRTKLSNWKPVIVESALDKTRESVKKEIQAKISSYSKDSIQNYDELNALLRDAQNAKDIKELETIRTKLSNWKPVVLESLRNKIKSDLEAQKKKYEADQRDISNYAELDSLIGFAGVSGVNDLPAIKWEPKYFTNNLLVDIEKRIKDMEMEQEVIENWDQLLAIRDDVKKYAGTDAKTIQSLRQNFAKWNPVYKVISEKAKNDLISECLDWIERYPDTEYDSEEYLNDLQNIADAVKGLSEKDVIRFNELAASAREIMETEPERRSGVSILLLLIIVTLICAGVFGVYKVLHKKIAIVQFKEKKSEAPLEAELANKEELNWDTLGASIDVHVICTKKSGVVKFTLFSPHKDIYYSRGDSDKKKLGDAQIVVDEGEYSLYTEKISSSAFAKLTLKPKS